MRPPIIHTDETSLPDPDRWHTVSAWDTWVGCGALIGACLFLTAIFYGAAMLGRYMGWL